MAETPIHADPPGRRTSDKPWEASMAEVMDSELQAIATLVATLQPLRPDARTRVINYVFEKLGIGAAGHARGPGVAVADPARVIPVVGPGPLSAPPPAPTSAAATDIRALKDAKNPKGVAEMVAVLAYYLAYLAPPEERSDTIGPDDIKKYFLQANFPLPRAHPGMTLVNTKNAGYLDARGSGRYSLNAVGHNLVAHKLPLAADASAKRGRTKVRRRKSKNRVRAKGRR